MNAKQILTQAFRDVGIEVGRDIIVHDGRFYARVLAEHSMGMGEAYVEGWWDSADLVGLFQKIIVGLPSIQKSLRSNVRVAAYYLFASLFNRQRRHQARRDVQAHYDIGNELYEMMLDKNMLYTCAYFHHPSWTLEQAQLAKIQLVYQKLQIPEKFAAGKRLKVLDIGCGWGYGLIHGAKHYGIEGMGLTLSEEQAAWARQRAKGLPIDIRLQDYRDLPEGEKFDAIYSLGMMEHVGQKNYREFMEIVARHLKPDGLFLLHTIGTHLPGPPEPWMGKYIFPGAYIPSQLQLTRAADGIFFEQDFHNFGLYYARTAEEWFARFDRGWDQLRRLRPDFYTTQFYRMWKYYLLTSAAGFRVGYNQLWQMVYSKQPLSKVYEGVRSPELVVSRSAGTPADSGWNWSAPQVNRSFEAAHWVEAEPFGIEN